MRNEFFFQQHRGSIRTRTTAYGSEPRFLLLWTAFKTQSIFWTKKNKENQNEEAHIIFLARARRSRHFRHPSGCTEVR